MKVIPLYTSFYFKFILLQMELLKAEFYELNGMLWHIDDVFKYYHSLR